MQSASAYPSGSSVVADVTDRKPSANSRQTLSFHATLPVASWIRNPLIRKRRAQIISTVKERRVDSLQSGTTPSLGRLLDLLRHAYRTPSLPAAICNQEIFSNATQANRPCRCCRVRPGCS